MEKKVEVYDPKKHRMIRTYLIINRLNAINDNWYELPRFRDFTDFDNAYDLGYVSNGDQIFVKRSDNNYKSYCVISKDKLEDLSTGKTCSKLSALESAIEHWVLFGFNWK